MLKKLLDEIRRLDDNPTINFRNICWLIFSRLIFLRFFFLQPHLANWILSKLNDSLADDFKSCTPGLFMCSFGLFFLFIYFLFVESDLGEASAEELDLSWPLCGPQFFSGASSPQQHFIRLAGIHHAECFPFGYICLSSSQARLADGSSLQLSQHRRCNSVTPVLLVGLGFWFEAISLWRDLLVFRSRVCRIVGRWEKTNDSAQQKEQQRQRSF